jgi:hypothetical protein
MKTILAIAISLFLAAPTTWASDNVFANGKEIGAKSASGKSITAFPDVMVTPPRRPVTRPGVPIPYPNGGKASDTAKGTKKVTVQGHEVSLELQQYFRQQAPQGATAEPKQLYQGKAYLTPHTLDVKVAGQDHFDPGPYCYHR